jgi:hypothetical protein
MTDNERWKALQSWIKGYILFDKIDRNCGNKVLMLMGELEGGVIEK